MDHEHHIPSPVFHSGDQGGPAPLERLLPEFESGAPPAEARSVNGMAKRTRQLIQSRTARVAAMIGAAGGSLAIRLVT